MAMSPSVPKLVRIGGDPSKSIRLNRPLTIVGSKAQAHLRIISPAISGSHALLLNVSNHVFLRDAMSRTQTFVNDRAVTEAQLKFGDLVRFGEARFRFVDADVIRQSLPQFSGRQAELRLQGRPRPVLLDKPLLVIGRLPGADLLMPSRHVSKAHAVLYVQRDGWMLRDLGSREGTFVNGASIHTAALTGGDVIRIGRTSLTFVCQSQSEAGIVAESETYENAEEPQEVLGERSPANVTFVEPIVVDVAPLIETEVAQRTDSLGYSLDQTASVKDSELVDPPVEAVELPLETGRSSQIEREVAPSWRETIHTAPDVPALDGEAEPANLSPREPSATPSAPVPSPPIGSTDSTSPARTWETTALTPPIDLQALAPDQVTPPSADDSVTAPRRDRRPLDDILANEVLSLEADEPTALSARTSAESPPSRVQLASWLTLSGTLLVLAALAGAAWHYFFRRL